MAELSKERERDLKNVLAQIEKEVAKGAIMRLGENSPERNPGHLDGLAGAGHRPGRQGPAARPDRRDLRQRVERQDDVWPCTRSPTPRRRAAWRPTSTPSTPWTRRGPSGWAWTWRTCWSASPSHAEEALRIAELLVKSNAVDIIVIDSVAALVPKAEIDGEIGDSHVGLQARLMSQALRILNPTIARTRTCMIFINQIRQKVGVFFGSPETTSGGLALRFYSSVRLEVKKGGQIKKGDEAIGTEVKVKVVKNKVAPPFQAAMFELMFEGGISREGDLITLGMEDKLHREEGQLELSLLRRHRPGQRHREGQGVPAREPGPGRGNHAQDPGEARPAEQRPRRRQRHGRRRGAAGRGAGSARRARKGRAAGGQRRVKNPHPPAPSPTRGEGEKGTFRLPPLPLWERGAGG